MPKSIYAIATLSGTIIGVGLFSLPYITAKVGFWIMLAYFAVLGAIVILIHQFFGELALETPDFKRLPGFAKIYLGKFGEKIAFVSTVLGLFGAILAYLIVGGEFLQGLLSPIFGGGLTFYTILYFIIGAVIIYFGIRAIAKIEFFSLILFFLILLALFFRAQNIINIENLFIGNWKLEIGNLFLPYGPILFSLWGASLIPEVEEMLAPFFLILGITGPKTAESALTGLRNFLGFDFIDVPEIKSRKKSISLSFNFRFVRRNFV